MFLVLFGVFFLATVCEPAKVAPPDNPGIVESCKDDHDCQRKFYCNTTTERCEKKCKKDGNCPEKFYCDTESKRCKKECEKDGDCSEKFYCDTESKRCKKECEKDGDCPEKFYCNTESKRCKKECEKDGDCPEKFYCDTKSKRCKKECEKDEDCQKTRYVFCNTTSRRCTDCFHCRCSTINRDEPETSCAKNIYECGQCMSGFIPNPTIKAPCIKVDNLKTIPETINTESLEKKKCAECPPGMDWLTIVFIILFPLAFAISLLYIAYLTNCCKTLKLANDTESAGVKVKDD